jgi:hypothetical protein
MPARRVLRKVLILIDAVEQAPENTIEQRFDGIPSQSVTGELAKLLPPGRLGPAP